MDASSATAACRAALAALLLVSTAASPGSAGIVAVATHPLGFHEDFEEGTGLRWEFKSVHLGEGCGGDRGHFSAELGYWAGESWMHSPLIHGDKLSLTFMATAGGTDAGACAVPATALVVQACRKPADPSGVTGSSVGQGPIVPPDCQSVGAIPSPLHGGGEEARAWRQHTFSIPGDYTTEGIALRFSTVATYDGHAWMVDDIVVTAANPLR